MYILYYILNNKVILKESKYIYCSRQGCFCEKIMPFLLEGFLSPKLLNCLKIVMQWCVECYEDGIMAQIKYALNTFFFFRTNLLLRILCLLGLAACCQRICVTSYVLNCEACRNVTRMGQLNCLNCILASCLRYWKLMWKPQLHPNLKGHWRHLHPNIAHIKIRLSGLLWFCWFSAAKDILIAKKFGAGNGTFFPVTRLTLMTLMPRELWIPWKMAVGGWW